jgi:hypothetical protein
VARTRKMTEINAFLVQLNICGFRVYPRVVEFNDAKDRDRKMTLLRNKLISESLDEVAARGQSGELGKSDTISVGIKSLRQSGSILMLAGLDEKDLEQELATNDQVTHYMLLFLKDRKVSTKFRIKEYY